MAFTPISNTVPQYSKDAAGTSASGYYLKFYADGTTTPISMATDSTGGTTLAKCQLNTLGYPINGSGDVFIPHIDQTYKLALYTNATDADNDTTANATWIIDNLEQQIVTSSNELVKHFATMALAVADTDLNVGDVLLIKDRANSHWDVVLASGVTPNTYNIVQCTGVGTLALVLRSSDNEINAVAAGLDSTAAAAAQTTALQAIVDLAYDVTNDRDHKTVYLPTVTGSYDLQGVRGYGRVKIRGDNMWGTKVKVQGAGVYGLAEFRDIEGVWFDGVAIANGTYRIDEASWVRASHRGNTGVVLGSPTEAYEFAHGVVRRCLFTNLAVPVERPNSVNTTVEYCIITQCWHGIFYRATNFAARLRDTNNYIQNLSGIGIGFYASALGYNNWNMDGTVVEFCCKDAAHDGIHGFVDQGGASIKSPSGKNTYMEVDESTYPNAIGIRGNVMVLREFWFQGFRDPLKAISTSSFWRLENGEIIEGPGTYDITLPTAGGRNVFKNVAFTKGLDPSNLGFTTLIDCSNSKILPTGTSNTHISDGNVYVGRQGASPQVLNRRASNGHAEEWWRQGVMAQAMNVDISSATAVDSGTADGTTANKLVDSTQNFVTTVSTGQVVKNTTDNTFAIVTAIDSNTQLSLDNDIMVSGETYIIYQPAVPRFVKPQGFPVVTVAQLAKYSASVHPGCMLMVSDETGGYVPAFSDGTNWRRVTDRAIVS